jgi:hypothetical protein
MASDLAKHVTRSLWLLLQMVLAMNAGMVLYHFLLHGVLMGTAAGTLLHHSPRLDYWMHIASMVIPMLVLMRVYHKSTWRASAEMTVAMLVPAAILKVLVLGDVVPFETFLELDDPLMIVAMAAYLLYRPSDHGPGRRTPAATH